MADFDIGSILSSLSPEDMESIRNIASSFLGEGKSAPQPPPKKEENQQGFPDLSQLSALVPVLQAFNQPDSRLDFINALKPLLSQERQQKADEALKLVRLLSVLPLLRERGIM